MGDAATVNYVYSASTGGDLVPFSLLMSVEDRERHKWRRASRGALMRSPTALLEGDRMLLSHAVLA